MWLAQVDLLLKDECIGHIQEWVGSRLRRLRKKESLGGAGRLPDKAINYFGIVIRKNNISMKTRFGAILCCEATGPKATGPKAPRMFCDINEGTW